MKENNNLIPRRHFLTMGPMALLIPMLLGRSAKSEGPSVRWRIYGNGKEIGLKVSEDSRGHLVLSARELQGKKLFLMPLGRRGSEARGDSHSCNMILKDGSTMSLRIDKAGRISSNMKGAKFGPLDYRPGKDNKNSAQNFWSWIGDKIRDIASGTTAAWCYLFGRMNDWDFSSSSGLGLDPCFPGGGFKLEPGMEEEGNVWY